MRWSLRVARLAGIDVYVHVTFLLLLLWVGFRQFSVRQRWDDAGIGLVFILVLFGIVVLHELGHALTARRFGIHTRDITLLPIGGVARLERMPEEPRQELLVALAGPAVNVCLAVLLFAVIGAGRQWQLIADLRLTEGTFVADRLLVDLMWVNVGLAVFNMIPAFPMDGGRVLRALLAIRLNYARATRIAATVGQAVALLFAFAGLSSFFPGPLGPFSNPFLLFIALFVWMGAAQESNLVQLRFALGDVRVERLMIRDFRTLSPAEPLVSAVNHLLSGWQHDFPVLGNGKLVGLLTRSALVSGLAHAGRDAPVSESMIRDVATIDAEAPLASALARFRARDAQATLVVARGEDVVGILSSENVSEYLAVQAALNGARPERSG